MELVLGLCIHRFRRVIRLSIKPFSPRRQCLMRHPWFGPTRCDTLNTTVVQYFYYVMVLTITFATMSRSHRSMLILYLIKMRDCIYHTFTRDLLFSAQHCCVVSKSVWFLRTLVIPRGTGVFHRVMNIIFILTMYDRLKSISRS